MAVVKLGLASVQSNRIWILKLQNTAVIRQKQVLLCPQQAIPALRYVSLARKGTK